MPAAAVIYNSSVPYSTHRGLYVFIHGVSSMRAMPIVEAMLRRHLPFHYEKKEKKRAVLFFFVNYCSKQQSL